MVLASAPVRRAPRAGNPICMTKHDEIYPMIIFLWLGLDGSHIPKSVHLGKRILFPGDFYGLYHGMHHHQTIIWDIFVLTFSMQTSFPANPSLCDFGKCFP